MLWLRTTTWTSPGVALWTACAIRFNGQRLDPVPHHVLPARFLSNGPFYHAPELISMAGA
jgi:hypothetical protein